MPKYDNTGALFKNEKKESDNHPDYKDSATVNGIEFWLSSWINTDKNGQKYMSARAGSIQIKMGRNICLLNLTEKSKPQMILKRI